MSKVDFKELSNKVCPDCGNRLKKNLVNRNPQAKRCYVCHKLQDKRSQNYNIYKFTDRQRKARIKNNWR